MDAIDKLWPQHCSSLVSLASDHEKSLHGGRCVAVLVTLSTGTRALRRSLVDFLPAISIPPAVVLVSLSTWARRRRRVNEVLDWLQSASSEKVVARCLHWEQHGRTSSVARGRVAI
jgi:hypothetical protein